MPEIKKIDCLFGSRGFVIRAFLIWHGLQICASASGYLTVGYGDLSLFLMTSLG